MRQESDGSRRVINLLPAFLELSVRDAKKVYVIDEIDRSLHTLLVITSEQIGNEIRRAKQRDNPPCIDWPRTLGGSTVYRLVGKIMDEL